MSQPSRYGKVAVVYGGMGAEREVSLRSGTRVLEALRARGVDAHGVDAQADLLARLQAGGFDRVFNVIHGTGGEDGRLQGALEWLGLPYTGTGVLGSALSMDKLICKRIWESAAVPTPDYVVLGSEADCAGASARLGLPLIVKPAREGSSVGMSKVTSAGQMVEAFALARLYDACVIAEAWVGGGEYTVSLLGGKSLPAIKIETPREFYDYEAKYIADSTRYLIPCGLIGDEESGLGALAERAFHSIGGLGWGRVDVMRGVDGRFHVIDVNTVPGMTDHSLVPMAAAARGMDLPDLCLQILDTSFIDRSIVAGVV